MVMKTRRITIDKNKNRKTTRVIRSIKSKKDIK